MIDKKLLPKKAIMNPNYISLPSEWDSSVSQLEMLQRMLWNINQLISVIDTLVDENNKIDEELEQLLNDVQSFIYKYMEEYFSMKMVLFGLTDDGYFCAWIPDTWDEIVFNTSGYDIAVGGVEYGHLVLSY